MAGRFVMVKGPKGGVPSESRGPRIALGKGPEMTKIDQHLLNHTRGDIAILAAAYVAGFFLLVIGIKLGDSLALALCTPLAGMLMFVSSAGVLEAGRVANLQGYERPWE
jgi:hypothetical protein